MSDDQGSVSVDPTAPANGGPEPYRGMTGRLPASAPSSDAEAVRLVRSAPQQRLDIQKGPEMDGGLDPVPTGARERQEWIRGEVHREGSIGVEQIMAALGVSKMTVHRDLDVLEAAGVLRKVRGGATARRSSLFESDLPFRLTTAASVKQAIGREAAAFIEPGQAVMCDESTTALAALQQLDPREALTVISNCVATNNYVREHTRFRLICLGGDYVESYQAYLGLLCEQMIAGIYSDVLLASCSGLKGQFTYHQDPQIVGVKRAMVRSAPLRLLLVDSTKIGNGAIYRLGQVRDFTHVITDDGTPRETIDQLREEGVEVIVARTARS